MKIVTVPIVTDALGAFSAIVGPIGEVKSVSLVRGTIAAGATIAITDDLSDAAVLTLAASLPAKGRWHPRAAVHDGSGAAIANVYTPPVVHRAKVVVSSGGNVTAGTLRIVYD